MRNYPVFSRLSNDNPIRPDYLPFGRPNFSEEEIAAVTSILQSGWVGMGSQTLKFEEELSQYFNVPYVSTVNSCTSALFLALKVLDISKNDEVICPSLTWCSTANAILYNDAKPVFCDVDPNTLTVTAETILPKITDKTKAVIVVHYGGLAVDIRELRERLPKHIHIIEDAAHALGSFYKDNTPVGSSGNLTCFSFYANKNLSTGEGGAIALFDNSKNERIKSLRQHSLHANAWSRFVNPKSILYSDIDTLGYKMNYTDLQAAIGRVQLKRQPEFKEIRAIVANHYYNELKDLQPELKFQHNVVDKKHSKHLFVVKLPINRMKITRDEFVIQLRDLNIGASIHYYPLHYMSLYNYEGPALKHTEEAASSILTLPISSSMTLEDAEYVSNNFKKLYKKNLIYKPNTV